MDSKTNIDIEKQWLVYILKCRDNTLYTGITNNLERRILEHNDDSPKSKAARYTRARQPVSIVYHKNCKDRVEASKREYAIKRLSRREKDVLIEVRIKN